MLKTSNCLNEISDTFGKYIKLTNDSYLQLKIRPNNDVLETDKRLQAGLSQWAKQILTQRQFVLDNMGSFFHFKKHEFNTFNLLIQSKIKIDESFKKKSVDLENKKLKLFESKNAEKWKIQSKLVNPDLNDLFRDYNKAKEYIIPDVRLLGNAAC
jgi:hypothetical protein